MPNPEGARTRGLTNHLTHARYSSGAKGPDRIGGVLLGLSSGSILQSAPSIGGSGEEALFKEPVPPSNRMALFGWKAWQGDGRQAGMDKQGQIRMLTLRKPRCPEGWRFLLSFSLFSNLPWSPYPSWEPSSRKAASPHHCFLGRPQSTHSMHRLPNISTQRIYLLPPYFLLLQNLPFPSYLPLEPPSPRE